MAVSLIVDNTRGRDIDVIDDEDNPLGLASLVRRFEESEESSMEARENAERDRRYVDNDQLDEKQLRELEKRGQPAVIVNRIKRKIDFLVGLEKQQRTKPKALPRTPKHEQDAEACTDALNYVVDDQDFKMTRSAVWRNMLVEGTGAVEVCVKGYDDSYKGDANELCIEVRRFRWDRFFADPHSMELDFLDATYLGGVWWMDYEDALARWPDKQEALDATIVSTTYSDTYDDKPSYQVWADRKRKRIRVVQMWVRTGGGDTAYKWHFAEFTKGGILNEGPTPYKTDDGDDDCGLFAQSAYVTLEGDRYGAVREMISPQDEINKRRSKALHLLTSNQTLYEEGAVDDIEKFRSEAARPDGTMKVAPGALAEKRIEMRERTDLAIGHVQLLQEAKQEIDMMGPNAAMQGEQGDGTASGRAIMASQQGGMIELGDLLDNLRHFDKRVYRAIWNRVRQFWTGQKWIRITDDERNIRFAAINKPATIQIQHPATGQPIEIPDIDPATGQQRIENELAQAQVDIYIDDVSDVVAPQIEQWQALVELKKVDVNNELTFEDLVKSAPNLRNKDQILEGMAQRKQAAAQQGPPPDPEQQKLAAEAQRADMQMKAKAASDQQALAQKDREHQQTLKQKHDEHQLDMAATERKAIMDEHIERRKAETKAATDAALARSKQDHDLMGEARKQELTSHYEGERQRRAIQHDDTRETIKHESAREGAAIKSDAAREGAAIKHDADREGAAIQHESAVATNKTKLDSIKGAAREKAKAADDGGDVAKQLAAIAKTLASLQKAVRQNSRPKAKA